ncbi:sensor histidine kinase [Nocardioides okcheonensis]|uniref:sensor histidine kinase n=1 Tax=Nocardioides okcheonensis TaxID=2894081 RepID=UPI001E478A7A|nr:PAS domain-containing sensor histidine kinase [Nocardioides okcheonensis]UFN45141.1 PAS domain-containing sensor histidine kinase [Nocardioides okcheonensis]
MESSEDSADRHNADESNAGGPRTDVQLLRRLVDQLPGMVAYWSSDLRLVIANADYCAFVGRSSDDLRGRHFSAVLGVDVFQANLPHLQAALAGERQTFLRTLLDATGASRHTEVSYSPDIVDGRVAGLFALITDITDRVRALDALESANRRYSDLIAMLGHDVRQPLTIVQALLDEIEHAWNGDTDDAWPRANVTRALAAVERMDQMLVGMLSMINVDSGEIEVHPRRGGLATLVAEALASELYAVEPRLTVRNDGTVAVDPFHLRQILGNLLSNAARYGSPPVVVTVEADKHAVRMRIADSGPGVAKSFVPYLFDRFARAGGTRGSPPSSTGFGLYMVRELVRLNGGTIEYRPNTPVGAEFTVTFPRA